MTVVFEGVDYYKRPARVLRRDNAEGSFITCEFKGEEDWHNIPPYTINYHYLLERAVLEMTNDPS